MTPKIEDRLKQWSPWSVYDPNSTRDEIYSLDQMNPTCDFASFPVTDDTVDIDKIDKEVDQLVNGLYSETTSDCLLNTRTTSTLEADNDNDISFVCEFLDDSDDLFCNVPSPESSHPDNIVSSSPPPFSSSSSSSTSGPLLPPNISSPDQSSSSNCDGKERFRPYHKENWNIRFKEFLAFLDEHGHGAVPHTYPQNQQLARWVKRQRRQYKLRQEGKTSTMTAERIELLSSVGFVWDSHEVNWREKIEALRQYHSEHGHCNVPAKHKEHKLGTWVKCQRRQHKLFTEGKPSAMTPDRIKELDKLGFEWEVRGAVTKNSTDGLDCCVAQQQNQQQQQQQQQQQHPIYHA